MLFQKYFNLFVLSCLIFEQLNYLPISNLWNNSAYQFLAYRLRNQLIITFRLFWESIFYLALVINHHYRNWLRLTKSSLYFEVYLRLMSGQQTMGNLWTDYFLFLIILCTLIIKNQMCSCLYFTFLAIIWETAVWFFF